MSEKDIKTFCKRSLLKDTGIGKLGFCEHCTHGKHTQVSLDSTVRRTKGTLNYIHSDLWGQTPDISKGCNKYSLTFIYDHFKKVWDKFLKLKNEFFGIFKSGNTTKK